MENIDTILTAIVHTGLTALCVLVLVLICRAASKYAKDNGWKKTLELAFVIIGAIVVLFVAVWAMERIFTIVSAWTLIVTNGASARFCHGVAGVVVAIVCGLVALWIYEVKKLIN